MKGKTWLLLTAFPETVLTDPSRLFKLPEEGEGHAVRRGEGQNQKDQLPDALPQSQDRRERLAHDGERLRGELGGFKSRRNQEYVGTPEEKIWQEIELARPYSMPRVRPD
jgi:hypothetical protein